MRHSTSSMTRVLTIVSLVVLSTLSFPLVYGYESGEGNPDWALHKRNIPQHRRAIHYLRAQSSNTPSLTSSPTSSSTSSDSQSPSPTSTSKSSTTTPVSSSTSTTPASSSTDSSTSSTGSTSTSKSSDTSTSTSTSTTSSTSSTFSSTTSSTSTSSSTTSSLSSNTTPTTSTTPGVSSVVNGISTTPLVANTPTTSSSDYIFTPNPTSTIYASSTSGATSKGFFANKVAVGATFSIVGIICGLAAVVGAIKVIRRYRSAKFDDDDFYEKYPGAGGSANPYQSSREAPELGNGPLGGSATDLTADVTAALPDAYPDRAIHYGQPNPSTVFRPVDYGIDYPPEAAYADPGRTDVAYDNYDYDQNASRSGSSNGHPFADPANAPRAAPAPPVTYPRPVYGRAHEMVTTDSYYGPNTAGVGAVGVGYAQ